MVQERFVESAVETIGRVMFRGGDLLNKCHSLDARVEVGGVSDLEDGIQLYFESAWC